MNGCDCIIKIEVVALLVDWHVPPRPKKAMQIIVYNYTYNVYPPMQYQKL